MRLAVLLALSAILPAPAALLHAQAAANSESARLRISQKTEVPGTSLSPGTYTIRVADHLSDRIIVQIQKTGSQNPATLLAYSNPSLASHGTSGPITYNTGLKNKSTLRGYAFPGGPVVEFIYPKKEAATLAKNNDVPVMAIDTASENLPKLPDLSPTDRQEVTLWMLTPTPIQPGHPKPGIEASRYQPSQAEGESAKASTIAPPPSSSNAAAPAYRSHPRHNPPPQSSASAPVQMANNEQPHHLRPAVKQLPHTASELPLISLTGCVSLLAGFGLTLRRLRTQERA